jgi:predicted RNA binding protein YcfA (HicA-like mRNA interferase family)
VKAEGKDMRTWRKMALALGWTITQSKGSHERWHPPNARAVTVPIGGSQYGNHRTAMNVRAALRRAGLPV